ncbi:PREDICTED: uncharacterized protein LOC104814329 [Tarenaya hassleriana]|uniref:uncharacterized protein LOC104814329 n=1 Tax=Tarenaya hassleriana TaxID=28532 RepID=UPI00053C1F5B|nr:PREDICTED: uncharacterized protein LOC104814329 [Tarenaya hassleriana]
MSPPAIIAFDDHLTQKANDDEWQGFRVFPAENPNPNLNFLVKQAILQSEKSVRPIFTSHSSSSATDDSFRLVLPPAMPPPRDSAVPLPVLPESMRSGKKLTRHESMVSLRKSSRYSEKIIYGEENFTCNPFRLTLPGFGKQKLVRSSKREDSMEKKMIRASSFSNSSTISTRASMEKFECGSWASTTALAIDRGRFFDLPVEMIKSGGGRDSQNPVTSGLMFERESTDHQVLRSVLKTSSSPSRQPRRSPENSPPRRVRFSASVSCPSSPRSSITPRLRKARDDFNAFLAAQNV